MEDLSPVTQVGFGQIFEDLLNRVNEDYGFVINKQGEEQPLYGKELNYDELSINKIRLFYAGTYGVPNVVEFETSFDEDYFNLGEKAAVANLEAVLREKLSEIVENLDED